MMLSGMFVGIAVSIFAKQTSDDYWEVRIFSQGGQNVWDLESWLVWGEVAPDRLMRILPPQPSLRVLRILESRSSHKIFSNVKNSVK